MSKTILVVEDNPDTSDVLCIALQHWGYTVLRAYDGKEGLLLASGKPSPDLILSDYAMPKLTGDKLLERLIELHLGHIPFVLMTAMYQSLPELPHIQTVLKKPFVLDDLRSLLEQKIAG